MCRLTQMEGGRRPLADAGHSLKVELERVAELGLGRCRADMLRPRLRPRCQPGGDRRIRGDPARAYHYWNHGAKNTGARQVVFSAPSMAFSYFVRWRLF